MENEQLTHLILLVTNVSVVLRELGSHFYRRRIVTDKTSCPHHDELIL